MLAAQGLAYEAWTPAELAAHEPALAATAPSLAGALAFPNDQIGNALLFLRQLAEAARAAGGDIRLNTQAVKLLRENGRITGVQLAFRRHGDIGQWSCRTGIGETHGLPLSIRPARAIPSPCPIGQKMRQQARGSPTRWLMMRAILRHPWATNCGFSAWRSLSVPYDINAARLQILRQFLTVIARYGRRGGLGKNR